MVESLSNKSEIFIGIEYNCPVCDNKQTHWKLKEKYLIQKRDIDTKILLFKWKDNIKKDRPQNLNLYHFWECESCYFTCDFRTYIAVKNQSLQKSKLSKDFEKNVSKEFLHAFENKFYSIINIEKTEFASSISEQYRNFKENNHLLDELLYLKRLLLSIYFQSQLKGTRSFNYILLASSYVRLSWVYSDLEKTNNKQKISELFKFFSMYNPNLPKDVEECRLKSIQLYLDCLMKSNSIDSFYKEVSLKIVVIRLYLATGQILKAKRLFIETKNYINNNIKALEGDANQDNLEKKKSLIKAKGVFDSFEFTFESFVERYEIEQVNKALIELSKHRSKTKNEKIVLLREIGFDDKFIRKCLEEKSKGTTYDKVLKFLKELIDI